ncbi:MAG TPA: FMN-binding glutamate synthase family protein [Acidimicrobiales bacterium]
MTRYAGIVAALLLAVFAGFASSASAWWLLLAVPMAVIALAGVYDLAQRRHSILRNYPVIGHFRFLFEAIRPEVQQYFIETSTSGRPFDRDTRSLVYERAKGDNEEKPFGTEHDLYEIGREHLTHSLAARVPPDEPHKVRVGGPQCSKPYDMALLNVSAMSFGSLSANAILALNEGARLGGFAHDTGEGGLSKYHLGPGGDLVWEIGSGYFGCRNDDGSFDVGEFTAKSQAEAVRCIAVKLSQGAKPGTGGVMPAAKVSREIAEVRGVPVHEKCVSPPAHTAFATPTGLLEFVALLRERSGGKPVGFKLCVGSRIELLSICKAMLATGIYPDFITVDGSEGGTGAAPLEFEDNMGMPLTEGLTAVVDSLVGCGLRPHIRIAASGKVATGSDIVKRLAQGADYTNSARAMMFALGCIQAQRCHTNRCPVGVTTQDPRRVRALVVEDKAERVHRFQAATVKSANHLIAAMGLDSPTELRPSMLMRRIDVHTLRSYAELHRYLQPGELVAQPPADWAADWAAADPARWTGRAL